VGVEREQVGVKQRDAIICRKKWVSGLDLVSTSLAESIQQQQVYIAV
jgi:hypothetical protein